MGLIYQLVFQACTVYGACHEVRIGLDCDNPPSPFECTMYGQATLAQWANDHPGYTIGRFKCSRSSENI